jgi:hypothetical protein
VVISAEAVLTLTDLYGLDSEAAVASIVHTARLITEATLSRAGSQSSGARADAARRTRA